MFFHFFLPLFFYCIGRFKNRFSFFIKKLYCLFFLWSLSSFNRSFWTAFGSIATIAKINCLSEHSKQPPLGGIPLSPSSVFLKRTSIPRLSLIDQSSCSPIRGAPKEIKGFLAWQLTQKWLYIFLPSFLVPLISSKNSWGWWLFACAETKKYLDRHRKRLSCYTPS